jgi:hypothetical protein
MLRGLLPAPLPYPVRELSYFCITIPTCLIDRVPWASVGSVPDTFVPTRHLTCDDCRRRDEERRRARRRARQAERARATTTPTTVPRDSPLPQTIGGHQARELVVYLPFQDIVARSLLIRVLLRRVPRRRLPEPVQARHDSAVNPELDFFPPPPGIATGCRRHGLWNDESMNRF